MSDCARCERLESLLDWAETLILNGEAPAHSTPEEWDELRHKWNAQKHKAISQREEELK